MSVPKPITGLAFVFAALTLVRVAIHFAHPTPDMDPTQIWRSMTWPLRVTVIAAWIPFIHGCTVLATSLAGRRKKPGPKIGR